MCGPFLNVQCTIHYILLQAEVLSQSQYSDVVEERSIEQLCGYPLCDAPLGTPPKQKYKISLETKQILDLTERKVPLIFSYASMHLHPLYRNFVAKIVTSPPSIFLLNF